MAGDRLVLPSGERGPAGTGIDEAGGIVGVGGEAAEATAASGAV
jgi:hypothetical protein